MKNKLNDLNDHLFAALERINDEGAKPEKVKQEIARARAIASLGKEIVETAKTVLEAAKFAHDLPPGAKLPELFHEKPLLEAVPKDAKKQ